VASIGKKKQFLSYAHAFLVAAEGHATAAKQKGVDGEVDGMMCVIALQTRSWEPGRCWARATLLCWRSTSKFRA